jgi:hypothetical protein
MEPDPLAFVSLTMVRCLIHLQALDDWDTCWKSLPSLQLLPLYSSLVILGLLLRTSSFIAIRRKMRPCPSEAVVLPHDGLMNGLCLTLFVGTTQGLFWDTRFYLGSPRTPPSQLRATLGHFLFYSTPQY